MISSKNEGVFIRDLRNLTGQIIFDAWRASLNVGPKRPVRWNDSRHASSWWLFCPAELRGQAALESYVSFVIKIFVIHLNMAPAQWGNTWWQKLTWQCWTSQESQNSLNWLVGRSMKQLWPFWRGKKVRNYNSKFAEEIHIWHPCKSILTKMIEKMFQTGS